MSDNSSRARFWGGRGAGKGGGRGGAGVVPDHRWVVGWNIRLFLDKVLMCVLGPLPEVSAYGDSAQYLDSWTVLWVQGFRVEQAKVVLLGRGFGFRIHADLF